MKRELKTIKGEKNLNEITIFENKEFGKVRTVQNEKNIWFAVKDICEILELTNATVAIQNLDEDEVTKLNLGSQIGETNFINESGLYALIIRSRKKEAKKFRKWITSEVLPSIRKNGGYLTEDKIEEVLSNPDTIIKLAMDLKEERKRRKQLQETIDINKPKVLFADSVETAQTSILIGELAKLIAQNGYDIGQNRLYEWLRNNNYLIARKGNDYNMPTQKSIELEVFEVKERTLNNPDGSIRITKTPKVTGKGQVYFINKFLNVDLKQERRRDRWKEN